MPRILPSGRPEWDGQAFDLNDPRVPPGIAQAARQRASPDDTLHYAHTREGGEWWLLDGDGELVEAFWLER